MLRLDRGMLQFDFTLWTRARLSIAICLGLMTATAHMGLALQGVVATGIGLARLPTLCPNRWLREALLLAPQDSRRRGLGHDRWCAVSAI